MYISVYSVHSDRIQEGFRIGRERCLVEGLAISEDYLYAGAELRRSREGSSSARLYADRQAKPLFARSGRVQIQQGGANHRGGG